MICVLATIELKPGCREAFLTAFEALTPKVRAEGGCEEYALWVDVPSGLAAQPPLRDNVVVVVEKWGDLAAIQAHLKAPHMREFRDATIDLRVSTTLQVLGPLGL